MVFHAKDEWFVIVNALCGVAVAVVDRGNNSEPSTAKFRIVAVSVSATEAADDATTCGGLG